MDSEFQLLFKGVHLPVSNQSFCMVFDFSVWPILCCWGCTLYGFANISDFPLGARNIFPDLSEEWPNHHLFHLNLCAINFRPFREGIEPAIQTYFSLWFFPMIIIWKSPVSTLDQSWTCWVVCTVITSCRIFLWWDSPIWDNSLITCMHVKIKVKV